MIPSNGPRPQIRNPHHQPARRRLYILGDEDDRPLYGRVRGYPTLITWKRLGALCHISERNRVCEEAIEARLILILRHSAANGHHERDLGVDLLIRPALGLAPACPQRRAEQWCACLDNGTLLGPSCKRKGVTVDGTEMPIPATRLFTSPAAFGLVTTPVILTCDVRTHRDVAPGSILCQTP